MRQNGILLCVNKTEKELLLTLENVLQKHAFYLDSKKPKLLNNSTYYHLMQLI